MHEQDPAGNHARKSFTLHPAGPSMHSERTVLKKEFAQTAPRLGKKAGAHDFQLCGSGAERQYSGKQTVSGSLVLVLDSLIHSMLMKINTSHSSRWVTVVAGQEGSPSRN